MSQGDFNTGLFTQAPQAPRFKPPQFAGSNPFGGTLTSVLDASTQFRQEDAFAPIAGQVRKKQRMGALQKARDEGLKPEDGDKYYSRVRDLLRDAGDMEGAEKVEAKRIVEENRRSKLKKEAADTRSTEATASRTESAVAKNIDERQTAVSEGDLKVKEDRLDFDDKKLTSEEKRAKEENATRERVAQISANASTDTALINERGKLNAKLVENGIPDEIDTTDITVAGNQFQFHVNKRLEGTGRGRGGTKVLNDNFMQLWSEFAGTDLTAIEEQLVHKDPATRKQAETIMASVYQQIAMQEKILASKYPGMTQKQRLDLAIAAGPGGRLMVDPETGARVMVTADNQVIKLP